MKLIVIKIKNYIELVMRLLLMLMLCFFLFYFRLYKKKKIFFYIFFFFSIANSLNIATTFASFIVYVYYGYKLNQTIIGI